MRSTPAKDARAESTAFLQRALDNSRLIAGAVAAAGSFAILAHGGAADAKTNTAAPSSGTKPTVVAKYTIKKGDTLSRIAKVNGVSLKSLCSANGLDPKRYIQIGQNLVIPTSKPTSNAPTISASGVLPTDIPRNSNRWNLKPTFDKAAAKHGVPSDLLQAMTWHESGWQNHVVSSTGAMGIGQLMPATVEFVNERLLDKPLNPATNAGNIEMSAAFLSYLIDLHNGDYRQALAAYYQGAASLRKRGMYDDTKVYIANVMALKQRYF